jgi:hypothetical protein
MPLLSRKIGRLSWGSLQRNKPHGRNIEQGTGSKKGKIGFSLFFRSIIQIFSSMLEKPNAVDEQCVSFLF